MRWRIKLRIHGGGEPELAVMPETGHSFVVTSEIENQMWEWADLFWVRVWLSPAEIQWYSKRV